jgi:transcriptional regulator with XRE-family HTH domain
MVRRMTKHEEDTLRRYRVLRARVGLTQHRAAARAKIQLTRYWSIEHGHLEPTPEEVERLAKLFESAPSEVAGTSGSPAPVQQNDGRR